MMAYTPGQEQTSAVRGSIVGQSNLEAVSWQLT